MRVLLVVMLVVFGMTDDVASQDIPAEVTVKGDRQYLDLARSALATAKSRYAQGSLSGIVSYRDSRAMIHRLIWQGRNRLCEYELSQFESAERTGEPRKGPRQIVLVNDREIVTWIPSHKVVTRFPAGAVSLPSEVRITPQDNWFMFQDTSLEFSRLLNAEKPQGSVIGFEIEARGDRLVITRRHSNPAGDSIIFVLDAELGYLPVEYYSEPARDRHSGAYEWRQGTGNVIFLANYTWSRSLGSRERKAPDFEMKINDWSSASPSVRFDFASLKLPEGTKITTHDSQGRVAHVEWVGGRPPSHEERMRQLGEAMRKHGFGRMPGLPDN